METTWLVVASKHRLRVFEVLVQIGVLSEVVDFVSPNGRLRISSSEPSVSSNGVDCEQFESTSNNDANVSATRSDELFSMQISSYIDKARRARQFTKLRIVSSYDFLVLLHKNLSDIAKQSIEQEVVQNLINFESIDFEQLLGGVKFRPSKPKWLDH